MEAAYSRTFSNFRDNCDYERYKIELNNIRDNGVVEEENEINKDISLWKHVNYCKSKYKNDLYLGTCYSDDSNISSQSTSTSPQQTPVMKKSSSHSSSINHRLRPVLRPTCDSLSLWRELITYGNPLKPPINPREELLTRMTSTYQTRINRLLSLLSQNGLLKEAEDVIHSVPLKET